MPAITTNDLKNGITLELDNGLKLLGESSASMKKGSVFPAGNEHRGCTGGPADQSGVVAAVVMVTFNRPSYLQKATGSLLSVHRRDSSNA